MVVRSVTVAALSVVLALGCKGTVESSGGDDAAARDGGSGGGTDGGDSGTDGGGGGTDGGGGGGTDGGGGGGTDGGGTDGGGGGTDAGEPPFDAGPCTATTLASALTTTPLASLSGSGPVFAAPTASGGVVVATMSGSAASMQRFAGDGTAMGSAITVAGTGLYGFDASSDTWAVMVSRGSDALYLVGVEPSGAPRFEVRLLGEVDHDVTNNEWFGALIRQGRLLWTGTQWAAYYTVNRLWPDGIAHYGDQLRFFDASGAAGSTAWGWGCSHSMEVRLAHNGTRLGPVCASDCFPEKGIHFNHRDAMLYPDEMGSNCAGGYGTTLGDVVPVAGGFWATFTATDARASHDVAAVHVANDGTAGSPVWLTTDGTRDANVRAAAYGPDFVVAWTGATDRIARLSSSGAIVEGPLDLPSATLAGSSSFFPFPDGDIGWITGARALARLRHCP